MSQRNATKTAGLAALAVVALVGAGTSGAVAQSMITGKDIRDQSVRGIDIHRGAVSSDEVVDRSIAPRDLRAGLVDRINRPGPRGPAGERGPAGPAGVITGTVVRDGNGGACHTSLPDGSPFADAPYRAVGAEGLQCNLHFPASAFPRMPVVTLTPRGGGPTQSFVSSVTLEGEEWVAEVFHTGPGYHFVAAAYSQ